MAQVRRMIALAAGIVLLVSPGAPSAAQPGSCAQLVTRALETTRQACGSLGRNQACYGNTLVEAAFASDAPPAFDQPSDVAPLEALSTLRTFPLDEQSGLWGVAMLNVQANIPDTLPGQGVLFVLYGDVSVENRGGPQPPVAAPCPAAAATGANVRSGPGSRFNLLGSVARGAVFNVAGRSADGAWLYTDAVLTGGWIAAELVQASCDLAAVPVRAPGEQSAYGPMQAFTVRTGIGRPVCREAPPSALVVQGPTGLSIALNANGVNVSLGSTVAFRATPGERMVISTLAGRAVAQSGRWTRTIPAGFEASVALGGDDGLTAEGPFSPPSLLDIEEWEALANDFGDLFDEPLDIQAFSDYESIEDYCADPTYAAYCDDPNFYTPGSICGDGVCDPGEEAICPFDCSGGDSGSGDDLNLGAVCGNFICEAGEDSASCPSDCGG